MMLTAKTGTEDRIHGLELGADDYVTKPFSPREVLLRARAILRRAAGTPEPDAPGLLWRRAAGHRRGPPPGHRRQGSP